MTTNENEPVAQPYAHIYEFDSAAFGIHRSFSPAPWNGLQPSRVVEVYTTPPAVAVNTMVRLTEDDLEKIYLRFVGFEGLSPRVFHDITGCVMTAMIEKSLHPSVALKCSSDVCEFEIQNEHLQKVNEELLQALRNIAATGYSTADRDKARAALAAAKGAENATD